MKYTYYDIRNNTYVNKEDIRNTKDGEYRVRNPITDHEKIIVIKDALLTW